MKLGRENKYIINCLLYGRAIKRIMGGGDRGGDRGGVGDGGGDGGGYGGGRGG